MRLPGVPGVPTGGNWGEPNDDRIKEFEFKVNASSDSTVLSSNDTKFKNETTAALNTFANHLLLSETSSSCTCLKRVHPACTMHQRVAPYVVECTPPATTTPPPKSTNRVLSILLPYISELPLLCNSTRQSVMLQCLACAHLGQSTPKQPTPKQPGYRDATSYFVRHLWVDGCDGTLSRYKRQHGATKNTHPRYTLTAPNEPPLGQDDGSTKVVHESQLLCPMCVDYIMVAIRLCNTPSQFNPGEFHNFTKPHKTYYYTTLLPVPATDPTLPLLLPTEYITLRMLTAYISAHCKVTIPAANNAAQTLVEQYTDTATLKTRLLTLMEKQSITLPVLESDYLYTAEWMIPNPDAAAKQ